MARFIRTLSKQLCSIQDSSRQLLRQATSSNKISSTNFSSSSILRCNGTSEADETDSAPDLTVPVHDVNTSIRYLQSSAYAETYKGEPVWKPYRRNYKGRREPLKTRKTCIRAGKISTGNPCPICRDEYLVLQHENTELLKQFIGTETGEILSYQVTGICQKQHRKLQIAVLKARDLGLIEMPLPFRTYDYTEYYPQLRKSTA